MATLSDQPAARHIALDKLLRKSIDGLISLLRQGEGVESSGEKISRENVLELTRRSRERSLVVTKLQEAKHWLGEDLAAIAREHPEYLEAKPVVGMEESGRSAYSIYRSVLGRREGIGSVILPSWEDLSSLQRDQWVHAAVRDLERQKVSPGQDARLAYERFREAGGYTDDGDSGWEDLSDSQRSAWVAAVSPSPSIANPYPLSTDPSSLAIHHPAE